MFDESSINVILNWDSRYYLFWSWRERSINDLTSLGSINLYLRNKPHRFENKITPPIHLDPNKEYEVGLINCFYPKQFLGLMAGDYACRIKIWAIAHVDETRMYKLHTYTPRTSTEVSDTGYMVDVINVELAEKLKSNMKTEYDRYFEGD